MTPPTFPSRPPAHTLRPFFAPRGVAVIGASQTPGKLGHSVVANLRRFGYAGAVYPVNPRANSILGLPCYPDIARVPDPVDLALIIVPAPATPALVQACGERGIPAVTVMSGGFAETGDAGAARQAELVRIAREYGMRLVGPNCVGTLSVCDHLSATFLEQMPDPGPIALISQSGAVGGALVDWAKGRGIGLSHFASLGNTADVDEADVLAYLVEDERARVFALYIEGLAEGRRFVEVAREVGRVKPIVALKVGGTEAGARAVSSHTAHLAGSDAVYEAAFRRAGIVLAADTQELFGVALGLAYQPPPAGPRVAIITNAGGPGAIAADALARNGLQVPRPSAATQAALRRVLGPAPQLVNPIDLLGAASTPEYEQASRALLAADEFDALLVILVPNAVNDPVGIAEALARVRGRNGKPLYVCYMGEVSVREGRARLHERGLPAFTFPEQAARALAAAHSWHLWRESRGPQPPAVSAAPPSWSRLLREARRLGRTTLAEHELYPFLSELGISVPAYALARTPEEAEAFARGRTGALALKVVSPQILHKSDVGGVRLGVPPEQVGDAFRALQAHVQAQQPQAEIWGILVQEMARPGTEVIVGVRQDPTFGPVVVFGGGGIYVEALEDVSLRLAPLHKEEARAMIEETVVGRLLGGGRGRRPADLPALVRLICALADLAAALPDLDQLECNPVIVHPAGEGASVVDARAVLTPVHTQRRG